MCRSIFCPAGQVICIHSAQNMHKTLISGLNEGPKVQRPGGLRVLAKTHFFFFFKHGNCWSPKLQTKTRNYSKSHGRLKGRNYFWKKLWSKTKVGVLFGFQQIWVVLCLPSENMTTQICLLKGDFFSLFFFMLFVQKCLVYTDPGSDRCQKHTDPQTDIA